MGKYGTEMLCFSWKLSVVKTNYLGEFTDAQVSSHLSSLPSLKKTLIPLTKVYVIAFSHSNSVYLSLLSSPPLVATILGELNLELVPIT